MKLLRLKQAQAEKLFQDMSNEVKAIEFNNIKLSWYSRGGIPFADVMNMSSQQLEAVAKMIDENLELTKKSQMPFF
jgi:hypothetical protein